MAENADHQPQPQPQPQSNDFAQIEALQRALDDLCGHHNEHNIGSEASPFSIVVLHAPLSIGFKMPDIKAYNGNIDPQDHLFVFNDLMELHKVSSLAKC